MTRSLVQKISFVSVILILSVIIVFVFVRRKDTVSHVEDKGGVSYPLKMKGISITNRDNGRILTKIEADELKVNPRKFYIFNVKSINEVTVKNANIELYLYEDKTTPAGVDIVSATEIILPHKKGESASREVGRITRGVITGLIIRVYKSGKSSMLVRTDKGIIDFKKRTLTMKEVHLENLLNGNIVESKSVIWDNKEHVFVIPGEYTAITPDGRSKGYGLRIDLNFMASK